jgi:pimeloyl-ACP methyl ester carboxylesterase
LAAKRRRLAGLGVIAAGAVAGAALEELVYRRFSRAPDPELDEPIGSVPGRTVWVTSDDGTRLYTRVYGPPDARTAVVFAHGIVENHVIWHYLVRNLRADGRHKLVAYDARGHGNSGPVHGPDGTTSFDADTLGRDLAAVVDQTTTGPVVLVGHSLGGMTALTQLVCDRKERERVAGAVLVCTTFASKEPSWRGRVGVRAVEPLAQLLRRFVDSDPARADRLRMSMNDFSILAARTLFGSKASPRQVAVAFHMFETTSAQTLAAATDLFAYDVADDLPKIDIPVLVVGGSRDFLTPSYLSRHMAETIPDADLVILEGCGHMAPFERHEELTAHVRKFADRVMP